MNKEEREGKGGVKTSQSLRKSLAEIKKKKA